MIYVKEIIRLFLSCQNSEVSIFRFWNRRTTKENGLVRQKVQNRGNESIKASFLSWPSISQAKRATNVVG